VNERENGGEKNCRWSSIMPLQLIYVSPPYKEWHAASDAVLKGNQRPPGGVACLVEGRKRLPPVGTCQLLFYDL